MMQRQKIDGSLERQYLAALVHNKPFLAGAAALLDPELFPARPAQQAAEWALDYWRQYREPPAAALKALCAGWVERDQPTDGEREPVEDLVGSLVDDEPPPLGGSAHLLDEFSTYLTLRRCHVLKDQLESALTYSRKEEALTAIQEFRSVQVGDGVGYAPTIGKGALQRAFAEPMESLIGWPKTCEWFFGNAFARDSLIGLQAPEKRGKTWWLLEFANRAIRSHRTVAVFQCGDLSERQLTMRWAVRMAKQPMLPRYCNGVVREPRKVILTTDGEGKKKASVEYGPALTWPAPLDYHTAYKAQKNFNRIHKIDTSRPTLMFSVHPNSTISVGGINGILQRWRHEQNFTPDLILIDYADILAPEDSRKEAREQVNDTWKGLKRLSQEWHACVVAPTQSNAASYKGGLQKMENFSNDKRKLSHVTGMLGLNQTDAEKAAGVMKLNWVALREESFNASECLWVAPCFPLGYALGPHLRG